VPRPGEIMRDTDRAEQPSPDTQVSGPARGITRRIAGISSRWRSTVRHGTSWCGCCRSWALWCRSAVSWWAGADCAA